MSQLQLPDFAAGERPEVSKLREASQQTGGIDLYAAPAAGRVCSFTAANRLCTCSQSSAAVTYAHRSRAGCACTYACSGCAISCTGGITVNPR